MIKTLEHDEQVTFFELCDWYARKDPRYSLAFAVPNAGGRDTAAWGKYRKKEGRKAGVPDVFLACPSGKYAGLFLEFKSEKGKPSEKQVEWMTRLSKAGYAVAVVKSSRQAHKVVKAYFAWSSNANN